MSGGTLDQRLARWSAELQQLLYTPSPALRNEVLQARQTYPKLKTYHEFCAEGGLPQFFADRNVIKGYGDIGYKLCFDGYAYQSMAQMLVSPKVFDAFMLDVIKLDPGIARRVIKLSQFLRKNPGLLLVRDACVFLSTQCPSCFPILEGLMDMHPVMQSPAAQQLAFPWLGV